MRGGRHAFLEGTPHRRGLGGLVPVGDLLGARSHAGQRDALNDTRARLGGRDRGNADPCLVAAAGLRGDVRLRDTHDGRRRGRLRQRRHRQIRGFGSGRLGQVGGIRRRRIAHLASRALGALGAHAFTPGRQRRGKGRH